MPGNSSANKILRSSTIIGAATMANIVVGLLRTKIAALILGPAGVGFIGLLQSLVATGSAIAGLGIANSAVRQLAESANDRHALAANRLALCSMTLFLAVVGGGAFWILRVPLARDVLSHGSASRTVGWLGLAVALTLLSNAQVGLLNGLRRIGDMARVNVFGAALGTTLGIGALALWRSDGIVAYVVSAPFAVLMVGALVLHRGTHKMAGRVRLSDVMRCSIPMIRLGFSFMIASLCITAAFLSVRAIVNRSLGAIALGHFSAAWMISMTYIGFVLQAMGTDYYPRLTAAIQDRDLVNRMVNEQSEIALLLAGPVLLAAQAGAPWLIHLLYSNKFDAAVEVLRWQIMGDVLKIASWPLAYIILSSGRGRVFVITECLGVTVYTAFVWLGIRPLGLVSTGIGFLAMYAVYLPAVYLLARRWTNFRWARRTFSAGLAIFAAVVTTGLLGLSSEWLGLSAGLPLAAIFAAYALLRLYRLGALPSRLASVQSVIGALVPFRFSRRTSDEL
jgi:PST family polysaccharide transporter